MNYFSSNHADASILVAFYYSQKNVSILLRSAQDQIRSRLIRNHLLA